MSAYYVLLSLAMLLATCSNAAAATDYDASGRPDRYERYERRLPRYLKPLKDPRYDSWDVQYDCWDPAAGLSNPLVTIVTIILHNNQALSFVNQNRLSYALQHGYRYCELTQDLDPTKIQAFSKLPLMLALLPCTDYVVHIDGDAVFVNHTLSLAPWLAQMQAKGLDLLLSADCIRESPLNFGVFAMRPAPWLLQLFKWLYNRCACSAARTFDWPAEQGALYDLLVENMHQPWFHRVGVAEMWGWNRNWAEGFNGANMMRGDDLVVHMTGIPKFNNAGPCENGCTKFEEIMKYYEHSVQQGVATSMVDMSKAAQLFRKADKCLPIHFHQVVRADYTYENRGDNRQSGSYMDWELNRKGSVKKITIGEIACLGISEAQCNLEHTWNMSDGTGPWMPEHIKVLEAPPLDRHWHNRQIELQLLKVRMAEEERQRRELEERQQAEIQRKAELNDKEAVGKVRMYP